MRMLGFILAALLYYNATAGTYSGNPLSDLSGSASDTLQVDPILTNGISVGVDTILFLPSLDTALNHVSLDITAFNPYIDNNFGAIPVAAPVNLDKISVAFVQLARGLNYNPWVNTIHFAKVDANTGIIRVIDTIGTNMFQSIGNASSYGYYGGGGGAASFTEAIASINFEEQNGVWAGVWSNDTARFGPLARSHSSYTLTTGSTNLHPLMVPSGALPSSPASGPAAAQYIKGHAANTTQIAFTSLGGNLSEQATIFGASALSNYIHLRWEHVNQTAPMIYSMDSISIAAIFVPQMLHVGIAADSLKQTIAAWTDGSGHSLSMQAYGNDYAGGAVTSLGGVVTLPSGAIDEGSLRADTLNANFDLKGFAPNLFLLSYARSGTIYYRLLDISGGSISFGVETALNTGFANCSSPSLAVSSKYVAFSYFHGLAGSKIPGLARLARTGNTLTAVNQKIQSWSKVPSFGTATNDLATATQIYHAKSIFNQGKVTVGLDTTGAVLIGFNNERDARVVAYRDRKVYFDSATYNSKSFDIRGAGVTDPLLTGDSVKFLTGTVQGTSITNVKLSVLRNGITQPAIGSGSLDASGAYAYKLVVPRLDSFSTPQVTSVSLGWNIQPRKPVVTGIRVGTSASPLQAFVPGGRYDVVNRRDTVHVYMTCWDLDNPANLALHVRTLGIVSSVAKAQSFVYTGDSTYVNTLNNGSFLMDYVIPPQNVEADTLKLNFYTTDNVLWASQSQVLNFRYSNLTPKDSLRIQWYDGLGSLLDSGAVSGKAVRVQMNDSASVKVGLSDQNDTSLMVTWVIRNSAKILKTDSIRLHMPDTARIRIPLDLLDHAPWHIPRTDSLQLKPDTLILYLRDPDTTLTQRLIFIPNHWPILDSLSAVGFVQNGVAYDSLIGRYRRGDSPPYLSVTPGVPVRLKTHGRDVDNVNGDVFSTQWQILLQDSTNRALWYVGQSTIGDSLTYSFPANPSKQLARIAIAQTDLTGAMSMDTINVVFPRVDTVNGWSVSDNYLMDSLNFVIGSSRLTASRDFSIKNIGSLALSVVSAHTMQDDGAWLDYQLIQGSLAPIQDHTQTNQITTPIHIAPNTELPIRLSFDVSKMTGDHIIHDTLVIGTNDYLSTQMRIPFVIRWEDLPTVRVFTRPHTTSSSIAPTRLAPYFPANSDLLFVFSEPILTANLPTKLKIYSKLDSADRGVKGITPIESAFTPIPYDYRPYSESGSVILGLTDTVVFTPKYITASDHFNLLPPPGSFIRSDDLGFWISNSITDTAGNALDLRSAHAITNVSLDTTIDAKVDTSTLRVLQTWPANGASFNPDGDIRILFSKPLVQKAIFGTDTITALDLIHMKGDSNHTVELRSRYSQKVRSDFRYLRLENGDSTLVIRPRYKFLSDDSVEVWISSTLASPYGHTLDGNGDGKTAWPPDTGDAYRFKFTVGAADFYVFPNPWKASNAEHRDKGSITFKNLHQIKGIVMDQDVVIRIYTADGNLVYSTQRAHDNFKYNSSEGRAPLFDWNLCNNAGHQVASGVYIYTISQGSKVLKKSKLMVIR